MKYKEHQLISELRAGNAKALRRFYAEQSPKLLAWIQQRIDNREDAQELMHDTFMHFIDSLPVFQGKASFSTYLISIAKHEVADYWRKKYAKRAILTVPFVDQVYTERLYSAKKTAEMVEQSYNSLLPQERLLLIWKYEDYKTVEEIATLLDISVKAAESRIFRARKAFQKAYALATMA